MIEEAYGAVKSKGFPNQFAGDWKILHPGKRLVGRAFTVQFMPLRPDVAKGMQDEATKRGIGRLRNQTVIDMLGPNDVIVVDLFGKTDGGTFVGDKLAYYIWKTTGTGMVVDGGMFWLGKLIPTGMPAYYRGTGPDSLNNVMLTGINIPIRIGNATVMPGDVVLGDEEGLFFIPPHLVKDAIEAADEHDGARRMDQVEDGPAQVQVQRTVRAAERSGAAERDGRVHQDPSEAAGLGPESEIEFARHLNRAIPGRSW